MTSELREDDERVVVRMMLVAQTLDVVKVIARWGKVFEGDLQYSKRENGDKSSLFPPW